jgi:hypothetical protein
MNGINERIKHATTEQEIDELLRQGEKQDRVTQGTLNRRHRIANKRRAKLHDNEHNS